MTNSKVISLLSKLDAKEQKELVKWMKFKAGGRASFRLLQYLLKYVRVQKTEKLNKEKIFHTLFRGNAYNDLKMRFMSFELLRFCEDFIVYKTNSENNFQYQLALLQFYRKRNLPKHRLEVQKDVNVSAVSIAEHERDSRILHLQGCDHPL